MPDCHPSVSNSAACAVSGRLDAVFHSPSRSFRVLAQTNVTWLLEPRDCTARLVLLVLSAPPNTEQRARLRRELAGQSGIRLVFLLGLVPDPAQQRRLAAEHSSNGDILQASVTESYSTLSYKTMSGFVWSNVACNRDNTKYIAKTDDDVTLNTKELLAALDNKYGVEPPDDVMDCPAVVRNLRPLTATHNGTIMAKFFLSRAELGRRVYPDLCFGWLYVTTPRVGLELAELAATAGPELAARRDRDDYFVTGFLRERLPWVRLGQLGGGAGLWPQLWDSLLSCTWLGVTSNVFFNKFVLSKGSGGVSYVQGWRLYGCVVWEFYIMGALEFAAPATLQQHTARLGLCLR